MQKDDTHSVLLLRTPAPGTHTRLVVSRLWGLCAEHTVSRCCPRNPTPTYMHLFTVPAQMHTMHDDSVGLQGVRGDIHLLLFYHVSSHTTSASSCAALLLWLWLSSMCGALLCRVPCVFCVCFVVCVQARMLAAAMMARE